MRIIYIGNDNIRFEYNKKEYRFNEYNDWMCEVEWEDLYGVLKINPMLRIEGDPNIPPRAVNSVNVMVKDLSAKPVEVVVKDNKTITKISAEEMLKDIQELVGDVEEPTKRTRKSLSKFL